jgi:hypothetical protein
MNDHQRWSDSELTQFRKEFDQHREVEQGKWSKILESIEANAELTKQNAEGIAEIREETRGLLNAWETYLGGKSFFIGLGKLAKWLSSLAIYVVIANWLAGHFPKIGGN